MDKEGKESKRKFDLISPNEKEKEGEEESTPKIARKKGYIEKSTKACPSWIRFPSLIGISTILISITIVVLISVSIYWAITGSILSIDNQDIQLTFQFEKMSKKLKYAISDIKFSVRSLAGMSRFVTNWLFENRTVYNDRRLVRLLFDNAHKLEEKINTTFFSLGYWAYDRAIVNHFNAFTYGDGQLVRGEGVRYCEFEVSDVVDSPIPDENSNIPITAWRSNRPYNDSGGGDYFVGDVNLFSDLNNIVTPFWSYSYATHVNDVNGRNYTQNIWFGMPIFEFSSYLKQLTPEGAVTWIVELKNEKLLGSSDVSVRSDVNGIDYDFYSPKNYPKNKVVRELSKLLMDDEEVYAEVTKSKENIQKRKIGYYSCYTNYFMSDGTEILIVMVKKNWLIYKESVIDITLSFGLSFIVIFALIILWLSVFYYVYVRFKKIISEMKKVEKMDLEGISFKNVLISFFELELLKRNFIFMVTKLKKYRTFLPLHLRMEEEMDEKKNTKKLGLNAGRQSKYSTSSPSVESLSAGSSRETIQSNVCNLFTLESRRIFHTSLFIYFKNIKKWTIETTVQNSYIEFYKRFLTELKRVCKIRYVKIIEFSNESIICESQSFSKLVEVAAVMNDFQSKLEFSRCYFIINENYVIESIIGNDNVKKRCYFGDIFDESEEIVKISSEKYPSKRVITIQETLTKQSKSELFEIEKIGYMLPFFVLMKLKKDSSCQTNLSHKVYVVNEFKRNEVPVDGEWMYKLNAKEKDSIWMLYIEAFNLMMRNEFESAIKKFKSFEKFSVSNERIIAEYIELSKGFITFCESMIIRKIKIEDLPDEPTKRDYFASRSLFFTQLDYLYINPIHVSKCMKSILNNNIKKFSNI